MLSALEVISTAERELKNKRKEKLRRVETTFDALSEILAGERRYFTEAIENAFQEQNQNYSSKKNEIFGIASELSTLIHSIEISCQNDPIEMFVADVINKKQEIKHMNGVATSLSPHPMKVPEMKIDPIELQDLCYTKNLVYQEGRVLKSHCDRSITLRNKCVPIFEPFTVGITVHVKPSSIKLRAQNVSAHLECVYDGHSQRVDVKQISPEKYSLSVTPKKRGNHKLL